MIFDDEFIESLPEDNWKALEKIFKHFEVCHERQGVDQEDNSANYSTLVEAYSFLVAFLEKIGFPDKLPEIDIKDKEANINEILGAFYGTLPKHIETLENKLNKSIFIDSKSRFAAKLGTGFAYEFSEGDLNKVQTSINELRDLISGSEIIEDNHKQRLLKRLERLQNELHKKMSDLDRFWGFVGDAGVVIGKFGKDAKPFTDRIKNIMNIVWRTQARAEELESGSPNPFLKQNNESDE